MNAWGSPGDWGPRTVRVITGESVEAEEFVDVTRSRAKKESARILVSFLQTGRDGTRILASNWRPGVRKLTCNWREGICSHEQLTRLADCRRVTYSDSYACGEMLSRKI